MRGTSTCPSMIISVLAGISTLSETDTLWNPSFPASFSSHCRSLILSMLLVTSLACKTFSPMVASILLSATMNLVKLLTPSISVRTFVLPLTCTWLPDAVYILGLNISRLFALDWFIITHALKERMESVPALSIRRSVNMSFILHSAYSRVLVGLMSSTLFRELSHVSLYCCHQVSWDASDICPSHSGNVCVFEVSDHWVRLQYFSFAYLSREISGGLKLFSAKLSDHLPDYSAVLGSLLNRGSHVTLSFHMFAFCPVERFMFNCMADCIIQADWPGLFDSQTHLLIFLLYMSELTRASMDCSFTKVSLRSDGAVGYARLVSRLTWPSSDKVSDAFRRRSQNCTMYSFIWWAEQTATTNIK